MTPEIERVVCRAAALAHEDGWSAAELAELRAAADDLRLGADDLGTLLAEPSDDAWHERIVSSHTAFQASIFALPEGCTIPLHDHPSMTGLCKVLIGRIAVSSMEWSDRTSSNACDQGESVMGAAGGAVSFVAAPGMLHRITALEPSAFLDLFSPYYADDGERPCTYYAESGRATHDGIALVTLQPCDKRGEAANG